MENSGITSSDALPTSPSAAAILGIKGPLRFSLHGSTQKPHVILRRVTIAEDSNGDGQISHVVRFSLFAQKRIEVKPGKEILLTVASDAGQFDNQCIVFEGDSLGAPDNPEDRKDTQVVVKEESSIPSLGGAIPPKMRRGWTKKTGDGTRVIQPAVTRSSLGIQAEPLYVSVPTQTESSFKSVSLQTGTLPASASTQVDPPASLRTSPTTTALPSRDYVTLGIQTDSPGIISPTQYHNGDHISEVMRDNGRDRSGSPMELDSSSPTPEHSPTVVPDLIEHLSLSPQDTLTPLSVASSSGAQDSPLRKGLPPGAVDGHPERTIAPGWSTSHNVANVSIKLEFEPSPQISHVTRTRSGAGPPKASGKQNVSVSAGFVTNFVRFPDGQLAPDVKVPSLLPVKIEDVEVVFPGSKSSMEPTRKVSTLSLTSSQAVEVNTSSMTDVRPTPQNAVASSSRPPDRKEIITPKVCHDRTGLLQSSIPNAPRSLAALSARAREKSPMSATPLLEAQLPTAPTDSMSPLNPRSRPLAYISTGPTSNPLNIRPSAALVSKKASVAPKTTPTQPATKKRVVVGAGWPLVKALQGITPAPPSTPPPPQLAPPPPPSTRPTSDLSNILTYSSPSPPPTPVPDPPPTASKWKRITGDIAATPVSGSTKPPNTQQGSVGAPTKARTIQTASPAIREGPQPLSLRDRIAPSSSLLSSPQTTASEQPVNGRDLLSRISDLPAPSQVPTTPIQRRSNGANQLPSTDVGRRVIAATTKSVSASTVTPLPPVKPPSPSPEPPNAGRRAFATAIETISLLDYPIPALLPSGTPSTASSPADKPSTPLVATSTPIPQPLTHPLPPKPVLALGVNGLNRGCKRERPISPDSPLRRRRRTFRWPTIDSHYTIGLKGEGELGVRNISFSSDGYYFALSCADRTIRIWNNRNRTEIARLSHNASIVGVSWMDGDTGVVSLGEDGLVSKWTRSGQNSWQWAKVLDAGNEYHSEDDQLCLAYARDRIAVSFPKMGVKVWVWLKGTWQAQRSILRQNVSAIKFVEDGAALVGGTRDGVLWYCEIPNGTLRAYAFLKSKINSLDLNPTGSHVLVAQLGGCARLVGIRQSDSKGLVEQSYSCKETEARPHVGFGAIFATDGQAILFGSVEGCVLVWDRKKGAVVYGLEHDEDDLIQAIASFDGGSSREGCLVTGTKSGHLAWWSPPVAASKSPKRAKHS